MRRVPAAAVAMSVLAGGLALQSAFAATTANAPGHTVNDHLMTFTPATVVDPILFGGEPGITADPTTSNGSRLFVDWPVSSRTNIGVLFRSTDGGLSFLKRYADVTDPAEAGPACLGRQVAFCPAGGGGDTNTLIDAKTGRVYFTSQESLANQAVGASFDHGTTFPADHVDPVTHKAGGDVDRQWLANWKGTNTVFLEYHSPIYGSFIMRSDKAGQTGSWYIPGATPLPVDSPLATPQIKGVTQSGAMEVDNTGGRHNHTIYVAYWGDVLSSGVQVGVSTDGAKTFTSYPVPGGDHPRNFIKLYLDSSGNLYCVWTDSSNNNTYLATSKSDVGANVKHPGSVWKGPYRISADPAHITIFPDVRAGSPGRIAAIYYGSDSHASSPDAVQPNQSGWYPYVAVSTNALCMWAAHPCTAPTFHQMKVTNKTNHNDNICTSGTTCAATGGNRNLLDYWDVDLDHSGHLVFVWGDTTNGIGEPFVKVAREASGPSLYVGRPNARLSRRGNGYPDASGDARFPISGANVLHSANHKTLDLRGTSVVVRGKVLEFTVKLGAGNLGAGVPGGNDGLTPLTQAKYVVRWDYGLASYYAGANVTSSGTPAFFSGTVSKSEGITSPTNPDNAQGFGNIYSALGPATGRVVQNRLIIDVPRSAVGSPAVGSRLISVGTYSMLGGADSAVTLETLPITVDASPTFDVTLSKTAPSGAAAASGRSRSAAPAVSGGTAPSVSGAASGVTSANGASTPTGVVTKRTKPAAWSAPAATGASMLLVALVAAGLAYSRRRFDGSAKRAKA